MGPKFHRTEELQPARSARNTFMRRALVVCCYTCIHPSLGCSRSQAGETLRNAETGTTTKTTTKQDTCVYVAATATCPSLFFSSYISEYRTTPTKIKHSVFRSWACCFRDVWFQRSAVSSWRLLLYGRVTSCVSSVDNVSCFLSALCSFMLPILHAGSNRVHERSSLGARHEAHAPRPGSMVQCTYLRFAIRCVLFTSVLSSLTYCCRLRYGYGCLSVYFECMLLLCPTVFPCCRISVIRVAAPCHACDAFLLLKKLYNCVFVPMLAVIPWQPFRRCCCVPVPRRLLPFLGVSM